MGGGTLEKRPRVSSGEVVRWVVICLCLVRDRWEKKRKRKGGGGSGGFDGGMDEKKGRFGQLVVGAGRVCY